MTTKTINAPPAVEISGRWAGTWTGYDFLDIGRIEEATADLLQQGARGTGKLVLHSSAGTAAIPENLRNAGLTGVRVVFEVSGSTVVMRHELGAHVFAADFTVEKDRMVGSLRGAEPTVRVTLTRLAAGGSAAAAPVVASPPAPAPAPVAPEPPKPPEPIAPAPAPVAPEPPKPPEPIAAAPAPPPAAEPAPALPKEFAGIDEVKPIYFDFDKADIRPDDAKTLDANADWLKTNAEILLLIEGYADERGTAEYNLALGERRAQATRNYLVSRGIATERIAIVGVGADRAVCTEHSEECWSKNRRAVTLVKPR